MILLLLTLVGAFTCGQKEAVVCFSYFEIKIRGRKKTREKMYPFNNVLCLIQIHWIFMLFFGIILRFLCLLIYEIQIKNVYVCTWMVLARFAYNNQLSLIKKYKFNNIALKSFSNYSGHWFFALMRAVFIRLQLLLMSFSSFHSAFLQLIKFDKLDY